MKKLLPLIVAVPFLISASHSSRAAPLPDLIATAISYDSANRTFTSVVANQGAASTPTGVVVGVAYLVDGQKCTWGYVNGPLAAGASVTIGTGGGTCTIPNGTHTITVVADDASRIAESNKNNNTFSQAITLPYGGLLLPDLIATAITYDSTTDLFTSVVKNQGAVATPAGIVIGVAYLVDGIKQTWGYANGPLAVGASVTIGTGGGAYAIPAGTHTITVVADDVNRIQESNKNNNTLTQTITITGGGGDGGGAFNPTNPAASGFSMIFLDNFPGTTLNPANWCPNYPSARGCNALGSTTNGNQISSCDPNHVWVSNGAAHLLLTNTPSNGYPTDGACMSSDGPERAAGVPMHSFQPPAGATGAIWIESTVTLPDDGSHIVKNEPSLWMNGVTPGNRICLPGWPNCGEIDYAEFYTGNISPGLNGGDCTSYHHDVNDWQLSLSSVGPTLARTTCTPGNYTGTHKYGVLWTNSKISYYVDGNVIFTTTNIVASSPMYLIFFNIADSRTTNVYPSTMDVANVNVWSHP
jgi:hypothetical protein